MKSLPKTMRAAAIDRFGGPGVLKIHLLPVPVPASGEVLIALDTAGVGKATAFTPITSAIRRGASTPSS